MKIFMAIDQNGPDFRDVRFSAVLDAGTGEEYRQFVSMDLHNGRILDGSWEYSPSYTAPFKELEPGQVPPAQVLEAFEQHRSRLSEAARTGCLWTQWVDNPFAAILEAADLHHVDQPEVAVDMRSAVADVMTQVAEWQVFDSDSFLDDLLQEIAGATGVVVEYGDNKYRARLSTESEVVAPRPRVTNRDVASG